MHKTTLAWIASAIFTLATGIAPASAQDMYRPQAVFGQEELDQLLAPVALYPDALLAQVLMAATYPLQVVQAARFIESRPGLSGEALAGAVAPMPWDPSVKSLVQFPSVLTMMNDKLDWLQRLGEAFLSQQDSVMDTVQNLRLRAQIAGNLYSTSQQRVVQQEQIILIEPVNPQRIYIPYYNPAVIYGNWWWPQRPPLYWTPPPRYQPRDHRDQPPQGIAFSAGIGVPGAFYGSARPDWHQHQVLINNAPVSNKININLPPQIWQHKPGNPPGPRRPAPAPSVANVPNQAMPAMHQSRPESEQRAAPPPHRMERIEPPPHNERPVRIEHPPQPAAPRPAAEVPAAARAPAAPPAAAPRQEIHREPHRDSPRPDTKPKPDDHARHGDDKQYPKATFRHDARNTESSPEYVIIPASET